ncbi:MAG: hypothetical protein IJ639_09370 [Ruminococcus sp.]|nr:hypothetical protein [Ruminococcus sp.]
MKHNKRIFLLILSLTLVFSILFTAVASARNVSGASVGDEEIDRGDAWEMLNEATFRADNLLNTVGNDFTDYYVTTLKNTDSVAKELLNSASSTTAQLKELYDDLSYLISEQNNPANHARFGFYTVAFTNNGNWSDPIYLYNWSDDGGEISAWPGDAMRGGYTNEFGQKQYYAFVPMDVPNIVISSNQAEGTGEYLSVTAERVQTVDIFVHGNTGYYLSGDRDGAKYKVGEWELGQPDYQQYIPVDPITPDPTSVPTEAPTAKSTEAETVIADPVTEPSTEFNIDDYIRSYGAMLDFYEHAIENPDQEALRLVIIDATSMLAPGNSYTPEYIEKVSRVRNFAVTVYNDSRSADNELKGARYMLQAAFEDKSYEEIVGIMRQWFNMPDVENPTDSGWDVSGSHMIGDADGDGQITVMDATRVQRVLVGLEEKFRPIAQAYACVTGSELNILDATAIQRYVAGFANEYDIGAIVIPTGLKRSPTEPTIGPSSIYQ